MDWLALQLADSAFPTGGFAHSAGLEAAVQLGEVTTPGELDAFFRGSVAQAGRFTLPFVFAAHDEPSAFFSLDLEHDARLLNHVANRASRAQGRAFAATCARIFDAKGLFEIDDACRTRKTPAHLAPVAGACLRALGVARDDAASLYLYGAARSIASAAVRLGLVGPNEAQRMLASLSPLLTRVVHGARELRVEDAAQTFPLHDLFGATHDAHYSRLFLS